MAEQGRSAAIPGFEPPDSARFTGFHYVDWVFDGDDIVYAIRTVRRAASRHAGAEPIDCPYTTTRSAGTPLVSRATCANDSDSRHSFFSFFSNFQNFRPRPTRSFSA